MASIEVVFAGAAVQDVPCGAAARPVVAGPAEEEVECDPGGDIAIVSVLGERRRPGTDAEAGNFASPNPESMPEKSIRSGPPPMVASTSTIAEQLTAPPVGLEPLTFALPLSQVTRARSLPSDPVMFRTLPSTTLETSASAAGTRAKKALAPIAKAVAWYRRALLIETGNTQGLGK